MQSTRQKAVVATLSLLFTAGMLLAMVPFAALAVPEAGYQDSLQKLVLPFYHSGQTGDLRGAEGRALKYIYFIHPNAVGAIVISEGYDESFRKYAELSYDLFQHGYSVFILDHRGQGASAHYLADSHKGYIDHFDNFVHDLRKFVKTVVAKKGSSPRYLLAHSLGGAIGAMYLERHPNDFRAAVLSSPMLEINLGTPEWLAQIELLALVAAGKGADYAPGAGDYQPSLDGFSTNTVTHSETRYLANTQILIDHPELFLAGQTAQWVLEGIDGSWTARNEGEVVRTPVLLFQAGQDALVLPGGQNTFCLSARHCELVAFPNARHEIFQEVDAVRSDAITRLLGFFADHSR